MCSLVLGVDSPQGPRRPTHMNMKTMFALLATMNPSNVHSTMTALANDARAEHNPVKKIAIGFILLAIALVIALAVLPIVLDSVAAAQASTNITSSSKTLLGLIPLLLVVGLLAGSLTYLIQGFRELGE